MSLGSLQSVVNAQNAVIEQSIVSTSDFAGGSCDVMSSLGALSPEAEEASSLAQQSISNIIATVAQTKGLILGAVDNIKADIAGAFPSTQGLDVGLDELPLPDVSQVPADFFQKITQLQNAIPSAAATMSASVIKYINPAGEGLLQKAQETVTESLNFSVNIQGAATCPSVQNALQSLPTGLSERVDSIVSAPSTGSLGPESVKKAVGAASNMKNVANLAEQDVNLAFDAAKLQIDTALNKPPGIGI